MSQWVVGPVSVCGWLGSGEGKSGGTQAVVTFVRRFELFFFYTGYSVGVFLTMRGSKRSF